MTTKTILIPLPCYGFDPTEAAIPWKLLCETGHQLFFCTPGGKPATADSLMLKGERLGIWKSVLRARKDAVAACHEMEACEAFVNPCAYADAQAQNFDALLLPGGHDKGMKEYLESSLLQRVVYLHDGRERLIGNLHSIQGIFSHVAARRHHHRNGFTDVAHLVLRQTIL